MDQHEPSGVYTTVWEGRDVGGEILRSGTYFLRLEAPGVIRMRKVVFVAR